MAVLGDDRRYLPKELFMALPHKNDRLSASIAFDLVFNGCACEVACYGSGNDFVCRITLQDMKPTASDWNDGYHPPRDGGMLWIRSISEQCLITGFVQKQLFPNSNELHDALDSIQQMLTVDHAQSKVNVSVLGPGLIQSLEFNGEQMDTEYS